MSGALVRSQIKGDLVIAQGLEGIDHLMPEALIQTTTELRGTNFDPRQRTLLHFVMPHAHIKKATRHIKKTSKCKKSYL